MNKVVAIVEDEADIVELLSHHLQKASFKPKGFQDGTSFFKYLEKQTPDMIILDLMLPDSDGLEICRILKQKEQSASIPVIMLTAKGEESDKIVGLELGADDYVTKPFSPKELVARVKTVLRRGKPDSKRSKDRVQIGDLMEINLQKYEVLVEGKKADLTPTEFRILKILTEKIGWVFTREQILNYLWGDEKVVIGRTIDVHIRHLREKLGKAGRYIKNIRGIGYKLEI